LVARRGVYPIYPLANAIKIGKKTKTEKENEKR